MPWQFEVDGFAPVFTVYSHIVLSSEMFINLLSAFHVYLLFTDKTMEYCFFDFHFFF